MVMCNLTSPEFQMFLQMHANCSLPVEAYAGWYLKKLSTQFIA